LVGAFVSPTEVGLVVGDLVVGELVGGLIEGEDVGDRVGNEEGVGFGVGNKVGNLVGGGAVGFGTGALVGKVASVRIKRRNKFQRCGEMSGAMAKERPTKNTHIHTTPHTKWATHQQR
jgi:hypothetical protein